MKATLLLLGFVVSLGWSARAQTPNDLFVNRTTLTGLNLTVAGNNSQADSEPGEDIGGGIVYWFYSVWYGWTAPSNGVLHVSATATSSVWNFFPSTRVYRGSAVNALTLAPTLPDGGVEVRAGDTVAIQVASIYYSVWGGGGGRGAFALALSLELPAPTSPNDAYADRLEIQAPAYRFTGGIHGATSELNEPLPPGASQTLWWKFVAPEAGLLVVSPSTPQFTPAIAFYEGPSLETLSPIVPVAGQRYAVQAEHEYALQMATPFVSGGAFTLDVRFFSSTNDSFATSAHLEGTNVTYFGNLTTATLERREPDPGYSNTIWVSWAAPFTGRARYTHPVVNWYQPVVLYTGPKVDRLQPVRTAGMDNNRVDFLAVAGTVYHFQISGGGDECTLEIQLFTDQPASNDLFTHARPFGGMGYNYGADQEWASVTEATAELGEPPHFGGTTAFKSLWWVWTAPVHGTARFSTERSMATNIVLAAYKGATVEALTLLGKGADGVSFAVNGGDTCYFAAAVPTNAVGDILLMGSLAASSTSRTVSGNLLREPSWEGTAILQAQYWQSSGGVGGAVNEMGGCDGTTWPTLGTGAQIWQDIQTVPGRLHSIRFAMRADYKYVGGGDADGRVRVLWDGQEVGVGIVPESELNYWHWAQFTATARNPTSRVTFVNTGRNIELDAFSVVARTEPPQIVTQPKSASAIVGGTVAFVVGVSGSGPFVYQWYFNDTPFALPGGPVLVLDPVSADSAGKYHVVVTNEFGIATSVPVTLTVEAPTKPVILWQPYGDTVGLGGAYHFSVVAAGTLPVSYQWFQNGEAVPGATNRTLTMEAVEMKDAGTYAVRIENGAGIVWSLEAVLQVTDDVEGGGQLDFRNRSFVSPLLDAPVFDIDGVTRLNGSNYIAQLYGGLSLELLRPLGRPSPFSDGFGAGYFLPQLVTFPTVPPGAAAVVQVRAWDATKGSTYEEARGLGGRFGKSQLLTATLGGGLTPPTPLEGLQSFSLQAGQPQFARGEITFLERRPEGEIVWSHFGEPGYRYLIERSLHGLEWRPYQVVTNVTSTVTFTDVARSGSSQVFYRSRILD